MAYDLAEDAFFHRELPFTGAADAAHPRLVDARSLVAAGITARRPR